MNRTRNEACTAKIHYIVNKPLEDGFSYEWDDALELDADEHTLMDDNENNQSNQIVVGTCFRESGLNCGRVWLIDTPGVNFTLDKSHKSMTEEAVRSVNADILIYLMNRENIGTDDDKRHLLFIRDHYRGKVIFAVNKVDSFRKSEDNVAETLSATVHDLCNMGFEKPLVVPVSAYAAYLAKMSIYHESLSEDEQDDRDLLMRKLRKEEYQFDKYYPDNIQTSVCLRGSGDYEQLLLHSGIPQLETMIYNTKHKEKQR